MGRAAAVEGERGVEDVTSSTERGLVRLGLLAPALFTVLVFVEVLGSVSAVPYPVIMGVWVLSLVAPLASLALLLRRGRWDVSRALLGAVAALAAARVVLFALEKVVYDAYLVFPLDWLAAGALAVIALRLRLRHARRNDVPEGRIRPVR